MAIFTACSGDCGWEGTVKESNFDSVDFKEEYCDDSCSETLIFERVDDSEVEEFGVRS